MAKGGKTQKTGKAEAFDFSLGTKKHLRARRVELVLAHSETLLYQFQRMREKIDWDALREASTEDEVATALTGVDQSTRERLPNNSALLATVSDLKYPKIRPIRFLATSCALAMQANPTSNDRYSPRYSRDICYKERKRRGPSPKPITNVEYWRKQAELGKRVPVRYLRRVNRQQAKEKRSSITYGKMHGLTYIDIHEKIKSVKKRTTIWLPEATLARLKRLSAETGAPMAELFRRAVEAYLKTK